MEQNQPTTPPKDDILLATELFAALLSTLRKLPKTRETSISITEVETGYLWLAQHRALTKKAAEVLDPKAE